MSATPTAASASCHSVTEVVDSGNPVVAVAGAPNVGKSTLFNALTGAGATTGNWPGTSTEYSRGTWRNSIDKNSPAIPMTVIDLPGAYSLDPMSPDEALTRDLLLGENKPDVVVAIVDAAHLARSLYLVAQLREHQNRIVVALTMNDIALGRGLTFDVAALQHCVGAPVVVVDPRRRTGMAGLALTVRDALAAVPSAPRALPDLSGLSHSERNLALEDDRFAWIEDAVAVATSEGEAARADLGDRIDRWVLGPFTGPLIFLAVMWLVFQATTVIAAPLQDGLDVFFADILTGWAESLLASLGWSAAWIHGLLIEGLIGG
ncbi:MAG: 50S ribosome-binding GTPase, partial [Propionibacteriaceae bacterium]|nr:50S ribosome-binding GTPase [Propionibacteriaceae bacterium]